MSDYRIINLVGISIMGGCYHPCERYSWVEYPVLTFRKE